MSGRRPSFSLMTTTPTATRVSLQPAVSSVDTLDASPRKEARDPAELKRLARRRIAVAAAAMLAVIGVTAGLARLSGSPIQEDLTFIRFTVRPTNLPITITERGTLESQKDVQVLCEVDDIHGDGIYGTPILWIVDNGAHVKEGDLIVQLDSSSHLERLDEQILATDQARAKYLQASLHYDNRLSRNDTAKAEAGLKVELAKLALQQYEDEQGGMFQIELQEVELAIQEREARGEIDEQNLDGTKELFELGYKSKGDLAQARLQALRAESALKREVAKRRELVKYDYARAKLKLDGDVQSAERALIQVERDNAALLAQAKAWMDSAKLSLTREEERLARYREQLEKCKIFAPQSGMVAYYVEANRWGQSEAIAEGVAVRERQPILSIPSLSYMQVRTSVHESVVDRVKSGMQATVRLDAFPNRTYEGTVKSVAVLPDPGGWFSSDTKVYNTIVTIDQEVDQIKPGMTAVVEMHIDYLRDVLCVPVQAVVQRGSDTWCYLMVNGTPEQRPVVVGKTNDQLVEICEGLVEGNEVVLNPSAILTEDPAQKPEIAADEERRSEAPLD